jgi:ABC-type phosphate transport system substrate-binding protein
MIPSGPQRVLHGVVLTALLSFPLVSLAEVVVVTGADNALTTLNRNQVRDLFLGKVVSLPNGSNSSPVDQPDSSPLREEFYMKVANMTAAQARAHWAKLYFTGRGVPPLRARSGADVKKLLNSISGAIGYLDRASLDSSVKVLFVTP